MTRLVDRLHRLAGDAARLARDLSGQDDLARRAAAAMRERELTVTHAGHELFDAVGLRFAGAPGFLLEDLVVRTSGDAIELDYQTAIAWLAVSRRVKVDCDVLLGLDAETASGVILSAFVRSQHPGHYVDGPALTMDGRTFVLDRLLVHPPAVGKDARNHLYLVFNQVSVPIRLSGLAVIEAAGHE